jgi:hypothetical protein
MQTYSHFILTAALNGRLAPRLRAARLPPLHTGALFLGSVLPDLPLIGISIYTIAYDILTGAFARADFSAAPLGAPPPGAPPPELLDISMTMRLFDVWFYENPAVLTAHNLFHGPLPVALFLFAGWWGWRHGRRWGAVLFWLSAAAMLHALIDIPLHATDGPLLFFPELDLSLPQPDQLLGSGLLRPAMEHFRAPVRPVTTHLSLFSLPSAENLIPKQQMTFCLGSGAYLHCFRRKNPLQ